MEKIPQFTFEQVPSRHEMVLVWFEDVPQNLGLLVAPALETLVGLPLDHRTQRAACDIMRRELQLMVIRGDLRWDSLRNRWELEV